ncbi:MAG: hypothetical protein JW724_02660 [Candidatus Altiarchaeota archaeon]|nr:hypothetical protein [Candidatus Altiarchaeota archaeon]
MIKTAIVAALIVLGAAVGFTQEPSPIGGHIESTIITPTGWNDDYSYKTVSNELRLSTEYTGPRAGFYGELFFTTDDLTATPDLMESLSIRPGEMYFSLFLGPVDLRFGRQMIAWGSVDALSPTDIVNPVDLSDLTNLALTDTEDVRIPVNGLRASLYPVDFLRLEGIFLPVFTSSGAPDLTAYLPPELTSVAISFETPATELSSFEAGGRASFYFPGIDFFLSYLYAWDDIPDIQSVGVIQQDIGGGILFGSPTSLGFSHNRVHVIGAGFEWPVFGIDIRGEAAYYLTKDFDGNDVFVKNPYLHYTVQAGYEFFGRLQVNLLFSQKVISNFKKISDYDYSIDPTDPTSWNQTDGYYQGAYAVTFGPLVSNQRAQLSSSVMLLLQQSFLNDYLQASIIGLYNFPEDYDDSNPDTPYGDIMVTPMVEYQMADSFTISVGANLFFSFAENADGEIVSNKFSTFGLLDDEDSFFLKARFSF